MFPGALVTREGVQWVKHCRYLINFQKHESRGQLDIYEVHTEALFY